MPQAFFFFLSVSPGVWLWSVRQKRILKDPPQSLLFKAVTESVGAERRLHQRERPYNKQRLDRVHRWIHLRSTTWKWTNKDGNRHLKSGGGRHGAQGSDMGIDHAQLLPEFDAVHHLLENDYYQDLFCSRSHLNRNNRD